MQITSKKQFYELSMKGLTGNCVNQFNSLKEARDAGWTDTLSFRYKIPSSPYLRYKLPPEVWDDTFEELVKMGADPNMFIFSENPDDTRLLLQAEFQDIVGGPYLRYSFVKTIQRVALQQEAFCAHGIKALEIIRHFFSPASFDQFQEIREMYPYHVCEFSCWDYDLGRDNLNWVNWETRYNY